MQIILFVKFSVVAVAFTLGGCKKAVGPVDAGIAEQGKKPIEHAESIPSKEVKSPASENLAQQQMRREDDQLLENALNSPAQQERAELASQVHLRSSYKKCVSDAGGVTPALLNCNDEEHRYQDARLNKLYRQRMAGLDQAGKVALREKQRAWIKSRDVLCKLEGSLGGGQAEELEQSSCNLNATAKRADELEHRDL